MSAVVVAAFVVAVALFAWRPGDGRDYVLVLRSTAILLVAWLGWAMLGAGLLRRPVLAAVAAIGVVWGAFRAAGIDAGAEIVRTYQSLFAALDRGINPYSCDCIVHLVENDAVRFGAFNYPPAEIWPYRLVEQLSGAAGVGLLTGTWLAVNVAAFAVLAMATRRSLGWRILAFFPFLVLWELQYEHRHHHARGRGHRRCAPGRARGAASVAPPGDVVAHGRWAAHQVRRASPLRGLVAVPCSRGDGSPGCRQPVDSAHASCGAAFSTW